MFRLPSNDKMVSVYKPVDLPVEDYDELAQELDVINLAKQQARRNQPDSSSNNLDANELNFQGKLKTKAMQALHSVNESISALRTEMHALSISRPVSEIQDTAESFKRTVNAELGTHLKDLEMLKQDYCQKLDDVNSFKRENGLRRTAHYPDSHWLTASILFLALLIESVFNGNFFAAGVDTGLIGGILEAFFVALVNVGSGFLLGWWLLPRKNHCNPLVANSMLALFVIMLFAPLVFNLMVAHYREALLVDPDNAHSMAIDTFVNGMVSIHDFNSWMLFAIGLLFCCLAIYKGYGWDDPYPGYGKVARRKESAEEELSAAREQTLSDVEELHQHAVGSLEDNYQFILRTERKLNHLASAFDQQDRILQNYNSHLEEGVRYVIQLYRDINISERNDAPPPYFYEGCDVDLELSGLNLEYKDKREEISEGRENVSTLISSVRSDMLAIKEEYHKRVDGICQI